MARRAAAAVLLAAAALLLLLVAATAAVPVKKAAAARPRAAPAPLASKTEDPPAGGGDLDHEVDAEGRAVEADQAALSAATREVLDAQRGQVRRCWSQLFNYTTPLVRDRLYFPKRDGRAPRFRFHCGEASYPAEGGGEARRAVFLSSYSADAQGLPQYVAYRVERPVFGASAAPGETVEGCRARKLGGGLRAERAEGFETPSPAALRSYNRDLKLGGRDERSLGLLYAPLCSPADFLTCELKHAARSMAAAVPFNRYLYTMNWARGDEAVRRYVAGEVAAPEDAAAAADPAKMLAYLQRSDKYRPVNVVAGPHFSSVEAARFDMDARPGAAAAAETVRRGWAPQGVWQAVVDPAAVDKRPGEAAVAWYCQNNPQGPFPSLEEEADNAEPGAAADRLAALQRTYEQGPRLCTTMSLDELAEKTGVVPFPSLPAEVTSSVSPDVWVLPPKF